MPDRALPTLLPWQVEVLNRLWAGEQFVISVPRMNGRTSLRRWVKSWDDVHALVFLNYLKVWDEPGGNELTSGHYRDCPTYTGGLCDGTCWIAYHQHQPYAHATGQAPRRAPCRCFYGLTRVPDAPASTMVAVRRPGVWRPDWLTRCFVIVFDCPHHGDDRYDPELLKGFTPAGEALFWETLDETERHD